MPRSDVTQMPFAKLYPLLVAKAGKKGRTREEVDQVTAWLDIRRRSLSGSSNPTSATEISSVMPPP